MKTKKKGTNQIEMCSSQEGNNKEVHKNNVVYMQNIIKSLTN